MKEVNEERYRNEVIILTADIWKAIIKEVEK